MRIRQLIDEIQSLQKFPTHKSTMDICRLLENNKLLFLEKMEEDNYNYSYSNFERLSQQNYKEYNTTNYLSDYTKAHNMLSFYLNRII